MKTYFLLFLALLGGYDAEARVAIASVRVSYVSTPVTTGAWVKISNGYTSQIEGAQIFDSSGQSLKMAYGEAGFEVELPFTILPGGNGEVSFVIPRDQKISVEAYSASATTGYLLANFYQ